MDDDYPTRSGIMPRYAHLKGMAQCMPVIRKLLGLSEYGNLPDTGIGKVLQRLIANDSKDDVREGRTYQHAPLE